MSKPVAAAAGRAAEEVRAVEAASVERARTERRRRGARRSRGGGSEPWWRPWGGRAGPGRVEAARASGRAVGRRLQCEEEPVGSGGAMGVVRKSGWNQEEPQESRRWRGPVEAAPVEAEGGADPRRRLGFVAAGAGGGSRRRPTRGPAAAAGPGSSPHGRRLGGE